MMEKTPEASESILLNSTPTNLKAEGFWAFSLQIYSDGDIKQTCLLLQDTYKADINLVLLCVWLDMQSFKISEQLFQQLLTLSHHWQVNILQPHRSHRRKTDKATPVYKRLLQEELNHERGEQEALIDALNKSNTLTTAKKTGLPHNLETYFTVLACPKEMLVPFQACALRR